MPDETITETARRTALLRALPGFSDLAAQAIADLAALLQPSSHAAGSVIVREGEVGDRFFVIERGTAEVTVASPNGPIPVAVLHAGELFGEIALLSADRRRQATVTALTELHLLALAGEGAYHMSPDLRQIDKQPQGVQLGVGVAPDFFLDAHARRQVL